ncbi:MAG: hypothetical protein ACLU8D_00200 [Enterocloster sp.]
MAKKIRPAKETDVTAYLRRLFLKTEQELIREIMRKRSAGYVDYARQRPWNGSRKSFRIWWTIPGSIFRK